MNLHFDSGQKSARNHYLLVPNINRSGVDLPAEVSAGDIQKPAKLDLDLPVRKLTDREIYSLLIDLSEEEKKNLKGLTLVLSYNQDLFAVLNKSGKPYLAKEKDRLVIDLFQENAENTKSRGIQIYLEAKTFPGSPLLPADGSTTLGFELINAKQEVLQAQAKIDEAEIRPAGVILIGDQAPAQRLLMCELDENQPSVIEVREAARAAGVPLTLVPKSVGTGDTWLQDQFQLGYTAAGKNQMQVILHLPRMVNDGALLPFTPNLKNFVEHYFPSRATGLFQDFWKQKVQLADGKREPAEMSVAQSYLLYKEFDFVIRVLKFIYSEIRKVKAEEGEKQNAFNFTDLYEVRLEISRAYQQLNAYTNVKPEQKAAHSALRFVIEQISSLSGANISALAAQADQAVTLTVLVDQKPETFVYTKDNKDLLNQVFLDLFQLHSPGNYGGNIEVSPPTRDATYGKILTGTIYSPDLKNFLQTRGPQQPLAAAYTGWLKVGHIDEVLCFVNDPSSIQGYSICRTSPRLGVALLEKLQESQGKDILVTRLLRGKKWLHEGLADVRYSHLPPHTYLNYIKNADQRYDLNAFIKGLPPEAKTNYFDSAYYDDRRYMVIGSAQQIDARYAAALTCADLLSHAKVTNRAIEDLFLTGNYQFADDVPFAHYYNSESYKKTAVPGILDKVLERDFKGVPVYRLPVLFDRVEDFALASTSAFTPDLANLQTLNQHVLVPRPYGPRMRPEDAVPFLLAFLENDANPKLAAYAKSHLNLRFIASQGLDRTYHWTKAGEKVAIAHPGQLPSALDKEFKEMWLSIYQSIYASTSILEVPSVYHLLHQNDPYKNHPIEIDEDLGVIANFFKDGFDDFKNCPVDYLKGDTESAHPRQDAYDQKIAPIMEKISKANPGVFNDQGQITAKDWTRVEIPENTVDIFELYTHLVLISAGAQVHWIDSWYYHTHDGGIHCGTNVLRG